MADADVSRASAVMAAGTLVSRILGFVKAIVLAATIGVTMEAANAFALANQLPNNVYVIVMGGVLNAILVPQIVRAGMHSDGGTRFINRLTTLAIVVFGVATLLATLAAPLLVTLYAGASAASNPDTIALAVAFAYWCLPQIFFYALYTMLGEVLNARSYFGPYTWAPVVNNVVAIGGLLIFLVVFGAKDTAADHAADWTGGEIALLAGSATLGVAVQAFMLFYFWRKIGIRYRPDFHWRGVGLRSVGRAASWTFGMLLLTQAAGLVQTQVAFTATGHGASLAAMQSAWLIFMLPHSIATVSIASAYFTRMSTHASKSDLTSLKQDLSASVRAIGLVTVFAAVALMVVAVPFSRVFSDSPEVVGQLAEVIIAFMPGLVAFSILFVVQRAFFALEDTKTPFFITLFQVVTYIIGALACTLLPLEWTAVGLAALTSVTTTLQAILAVILLARKLGGFSVWRAVRSHAVYLLAMLPATAVGVLILVPLGVFDGGFAWDSRITALITMAISAALMAVAYAAGLIALRSPEFFGFVGLIRARIRR